MQATQQELIALLQIQQVDIERERLQRRAQTLPQYDRLVEIKKKATKLLSKQDELNELEKQLEAKIDNLDQQKAGLNQRLVDIQREIDHAGSDYRSIESHTQELSKVGKRIKDIENRIEESSAKWEQIQALQEKVDHAIAEAKNNVAQLEKSYRQELETLQQEMNTLKGKSTKYEANVNSDLLKIFRDKQKKVGTVAIGKIKEEACGICRTPIAHGHLIQMANEAPLSQCPHCKRLMIME